MAFAAATCHSSRRRDQQSGRCTDVQVLRVVRTVGVDVLDVVVKDMIVPADLRAAYAQLVSARHQAQIKLETARAETAALRSLANAAKLLDEHPALAKVRLVEALPYGAKVALTVGE